MNISEAYVLILYPLINWKTLGIKSAQRVWIETQNRMRLHAIHRKDV
jgi:hypothetical protein